MGLVNIQSTNTTDLTNADRPFDDEEVEAEQQAVKFPVSFYKRIKPVHGTLGYAFRNFAGRNHVVIEALRYIDSKSNQTHKFIKNFIILWNNMDEYSKKRVDIFDWLCEKYDISKAKFFGVVQEGMFTFDDMLAQSAISGYKPEFIELVKRMTKNTKNARDRELYAKMAGLTKDAPLIGEVRNDNSVTNNTVNIEGSPLPSFVQSMRKADQGIRTLAENPQKSLTEGTQDYIDAEIVDEKDKELVDFSKRAEEEFKKAAKELG